VNATKVAPAGYMGEYGNGLWKTFRPGTHTFVVPSGVYKVRIRVVGAGGGSPGAGGGGYAHGVFDVVPGTSYTVTVPDFTAAAADGGTTSFGALISAGARHRELVERLRAKGIRSMTQDGLAKVAAGTTTMEEIFRINACTRSEEAVRQEADAEPIAAPVG
jgi:hypothetical protein